MASQRFEKGSEMFFMFQDYWKLVQKFYIPEDNDQYWADFHESVNDFYRRYHTEYAKSLATSFIDELDRKWEMMQKK